jgi:hypothetical protein
VAGESETLSDAVLGDWRIQREKELGGFLKAKDDRLYSLIVHLQAARSKLDLREREIKRLEITAKVQAKAHWGTINELARVRARIVSLEKLRKPKRGGTR